jgi:hypothetical protein
MTIERVLETHLFCLPEGVVLSPLLLCFPCRGSREEAVWYDAGFSQLPRIHPKIPQIISNAWLVEAHPVIRAGRYQGLDAEDSP